MFQWWHSQGRGGIQRRSRRIDHSASCSPPSLPHSHLRSDAHRCRSAAAPSAARCIGRLGWRAECHPREQIGLPDETRPDAVAGTCKDAVLAVGISFLRRRDTADLHGKRNARGRGIPGLSPALNLGQRRSWANRFDSDLLEHKAQAAGKLMLKEDPIGFAASTCYVEDATDKENRLGRELCPLKIKSQQLHGSEPAAVSKARLATGVRVSLPHEPLHIEAYGRDPFIELPLFSLARLTTI